MQILPIRLLRILAVANFAIGMGAFVVVGILTPLADAFALGPGGAGWAMTAYAIVYALTSPVLVALTGGFDRKAVLIAGLALFGLGAAVAASAPNFTALLAARAVMALGGGLVTPVCAALAVGLSAPQDRGRALSIAFGGLTLAQVLGVPAGSWLGYALGWQAAFAVVAMLSGLAAAALWREVPRGVAVPRASLSVLGAALASGTLMLAVAFTVLFLAGLYHVYTYFAPLMEARLGLGRDGVSAMLLIFGAGAVVGNLVGGRLADRIGPDRTLLLLCTLQVPLLLILSGVQMPLILTAAMVAVWSLCAWSFMAPQQARLAALDPARAPVVLSLNAAAIYVGASLGTFSGGLVLDRTGLWAMLGVAGVGFVALAAVSLAGVARRRGGQLVRSK
jgi:predicted MFS family arabinose efflux permease